MRDGFIFMFFVLIFLHLLVLVKSCCDLLLHISVFIIWYASQVEDFVEFKHSLKKRKDSIEKRAVLLIFSFELEIAGIGVQRIHQNSEKWWLLWGVAQLKWLEAVLATFCYYDYGTNASKAVRKIARDQKDYHKCPSYVIVCWVAKIYKSITVKKGGYLLTRTRPT